MVLLQSKINNKVVLSRSFLHLLRIFCELKEQFLRVWKNLAQPPGIRPSVFAPEQGIRQKIARVAGIGSFKKNFPGGVPVGID